MTNHVDCFAEDPRTSSEQIAAGFPEADLQTAIEVLGVLLAENSGCVSSLALRKALERKGIEEARQLVVHLRLSDGSPRLSVHHSGRSFYSAEKYQDLEREREKAAEAASQNEDTQPRPSAEGETERRANRQQEARLVTYVCDALEEIYSTEFSPEDRRIAFDVHNTRAGGDYENVDLIAVDWRSPAHVDLVTVEVKLQFSPQLIQQASNYCRFSDRVWIAVPIQADLLDAATELRESSPRLFDQVIERGLGVLACRRTYGRSYTVLPIQWPRRLTIDPVERHEFVERHRDCLEEAGVVPPRRTDRYPRIS